MNAIWYKLGGVCTSWKKYLAESETVLTLNWLLKWKWIWIELSE